MEKDGTPECFFLEYNDLPDEATILSHADIYINNKNITESNNQQ